MLLRYIDHKMMVHRLAVLLTFQLVFWYGGKQRGPGWPPKWAEQLLEEGASNQSAKTTIDEQQGNKGSQREMILKKQAPVFNVSQHQLA